MDEALTYRLMSPADVLDVSKLVARVFNEFNAPGYSAKGVQEFYRYSQPSAFHARQQTDHFALISVTQDQVVGMIEVRENHHVSLLFVAPEFQRRGIAKELLHRALLLCQANEPRLSEISVNSSPYAVLIYEKLGFRRTGEQQLSNGISFIPMALRLSAR